MFIHHSKCSNEDEGCLGNEIKVSILKWLILYGTA